MGLFSSAAHEVSYYALAEDLEDGFVLHGPRAALALDLSPATEWLGFSLDRRFFSTSYEVPVKLLVDHAGSDRVGISVGGRVVAQWGVW